MSQALWFSSPIFEKNVANFSLFVGRCESRALLHSLSNWLSGEITAHYSCLFGLQSREMCRATSIAKQGKPNVNILSIYEKVTMVSECSHHNHLSGDIFDTLKHPCIFRFPAAISMLSHSNLLL
jgi:hypothetical protein